MAVSKARWRLSVKLLRSSQGSSARAVPSVRLFPAVSPGEADTVRVRSVLAFARDIGLYPKPPGPKKTEVSAAPAPPPEEKPRDAPPRFSDAKTSIWNDYCRMTWSKYGLDPPEAYERETQRAGLLSFVRGKVTRGSFPASTYPTLGEAEAAARRHHHLSPTHAFPRFSDAHDKSFRDVIETTRMTYEALSNKYGIGVDALPEVGYATALNLSNAVQRGFFHIFETAKYSKRCAEISRALFGREFQPLEIGLTEAARNDVVRAVCVFEKFIQPHITTWITKLKLDADALMALGLVTRATTLAALPLKREGMLALGYTYPWMQRNFGIAPPQLHMGWGEGSPRHVLLGREPFSLQDWASLGYRPGNATPQYAEKVRGEAPDHGNSITVAQVRAAFIPPQYN